MLMKVATDHGNYANRQRKCGEVQKNGPQSFRCSEFHQNLCEKLEKGLHGPDALRELEMLVANLICAHVHAKSTRDRLPSIQRSTGRSRSSGWAPLIKLLRACASSFFWLGFLIVLNFFYLPNEAAKSLLNWHR